MYSDVYLQILRKILIIAIVEGVIGQTNQNSLLHYKIRHAFVRYW